MAKLLVSVRSVGEAKAALAGGAALIDVKEPAAGSLGRAADETVAAVIQHIDGRRPVSAALGELRDDAALARSALAGLAYAKWGLSRCIAYPSWRQAFAKANADLEVSIPGCRAVTVAYADWQNAQAPPFREVCAFVCAHRSAAFLLDTWNKDGWTLLDWLPAAEITELCRRCHRAGIQVALAGSLGPRQIRLLKSADPDWFAVRGSACLHGHRNQPIDCQRVQDLAALVAG